ncbi:MULTISPECIES: hypothetical protein [unclassified Sphingobacterium]|uniref:hypothetical protein n=1 Tax=unclassified Sphingobacterium TaxID=2609468 RepID=UPI001404A81B|nr:MULTISPECIES: hypothetical protein [unclassified Sphingobacterium]MCS3553540.1 hypothetical protein [Sphingobacterium sp. JUb21]
MMIKAAANSKFMILSYDWIHEDVVQEGIELIGNNNKQSEVTASWIDSWGMGGKL